MSKTLVIAEKPSVAQDIVRALTPVAGKFDKHEDHFENDQYVVTSAVGHLVEIQAPEQYDVKRGKWSFAHLPVIPPHFDLKPVDKTKSRLSAVVKQAKRKDVTQLINACDAGREGELIFRDLLAVITAAGDPASVQPAPGRSELLERIHEIEAIEQLAAISRGSAFANAVGHAGKDIAKTIARIGTHPIGTVKSIPGGLLRSLRSKWRDLREQTARARDKASEELREDDEAPGIGPQSPTPHARESDWWLHSQQTTGKLAKRWIGFTAARRTLAQRMAVDPYSRNALLNRELDRLAGFLVRNPAELTLPAPWKQWRRIPTQWVNKR